MKTKKEISKIMPAICFSLLFHAVLCGLLFFGTSNNMITPAGLGGINLVWVSLGAGGKQQQHINAAQASKHNQKHQGRDELISQPAVEAIYAPTQTANSLKLSDYKIHHAVAERESIGNINVSVGRQTFGDAAPGGAFTAYPLYQENMPPVYPEIARIRGYEGIVLIAAEILPTGRVGEAKIRKSSGYSILDQSALDAVKPWKFEPAKKSGRPFTMWVEVPIKFVLRNYETSS